jgi:hypothetical protein
MLQGQNVLHPLAKESLGLVACACYVCKAPPAMSYEDRHCWHLLPILLAREPTITSYLQQVQLHHPSRRNSQQEQQNYQA